MLELREELVAPRSAPTAASRDGAAGNGRLTAVTAALGAGARLAALAFSAAGSWG